MRQKDFVRKLTERLQIEFEKQDRSGVYGLTQRMMAYNSNKIEGSTLTEEQTASMFDTGTLYSDDPEVIFRAKDIEEMNGHFKMFNYMLKTLDEPLSEDVIKAFHKNLKEGVFEDFANGYAIGDYKKRRNQVSTITTSEPQDVHNDMQTLLDDYRANKRIGILELAVFHARFEKIHPFQDGNGRVGRMILLRECLVNGVIPVIIQDINKTEYYRNLLNVQTKNQVEGLSGYFKFEQEEYYRKAAPYVIDQDELQKLDIGHLFVNSDPV